jgi:hypothetical protein
MAPSALSAEVGFNFTSRIGFIAMGGNPDYGETYGVRLTPFSNFSGHLVFESHTPAYSIATETCADCTAYDHKQINGLHVEFDGLTLQADEYIIEVQNDVDAHPYGLSDVLVVSFPDQSFGGNRKLGKPLLINGVPYSRGSFSMNLVASSEAFSSSELPTSLDPSVFALPGGAGFFGDGLPEHNTLDVFFTPQTLAAFPHSTSDHDLDGDVDGRDFLIWQRNVSLTTGDGDADSNLFVDHHDLEMWQAEYGAPVAEFVATVAVPEPDCWSLLAGVCLIGLRRRGES